MDQCAYQTINEIQDRSWKHFFRQMFVCISVWSCYFSNGLFIGAPTVIIPQMRREANATDFITPEMASWISSIPGFSGLPWVIILPVASSKMGRKYPFIFITVCNLTASVVLYFSNTAEHFLLAGIIQGPMFGGCVTITVVIVTEYTSPEYRGLFSTIKSASFNWGIWTSNALGTFLPWRTISIAGMICAVSSIIISLFWCESPYWVASKYQYEACSRSHRWLKGTTEASEKELSTLISSYRQHENKVMDKKEEQFLKLYFRTMFKREFYKPILLCCGVIALSHTSGKLVCTIYAIDIIKDITSSESTAYTGMLILDGVTVAAMYVGAGLSKVTKRRTLLFASTTFGIAIIYILSFYLALIHFAVIPENKFVTLTLLVLFTIGVGAGTMILSSSLYGELIPEKFKTSTMLITAFSTLIMISVTMKLAPVMFKTLKFYGAFLFFGATSSIVLFLLYKFLPETKDKTLQEINECVMLRTLDKDNKI